MPTTKPAMIGLYLLLGELVLCARATAQDLADHKLSSSSTYSLSNKPKFSSTKRQFSSIEPFISERTKNSIRPPGSGADSESSSSNPNSSKSRQLQLFAPIQFGDYNTYTAGQAEPMLAEPHYGLLPTTTSAYDAFTFEFGYPVVSWSRQNGFASRPRTISKVPFRIATSKLGVARRGKSPVLIVRAKITN